MSGKNVALYAQRNLNTLHKLTDFQARDKVKANRERERVVQT